MNVLVIGATGGVGKHLLPLLADQHQVVAMARSDAQLAAFEAKGVDAVAASLEQPVNQLAAAMAGMDAVVFSAGSGGATGSDKTLLIDLDGAVKAMEAAKASGATRFLMVSAIQAHHRPNWNESLLPYYAAKHYADRELMASGLGYTIVRPALLKDEPGTGLITAAKDITSGGAIARQDVARVLAACLDTPHTQGQAFDLISGETPIPQALAAL
ncbi:MAG: SDR family oxidoreductase [Pseudomonadota bacterium]|nr:SDR family oxidoreductase [Pseudomonadota bacterium]